MSEEPGLFEQLVSKFRRYPDKVCLQQQNGSVLRYGEIEGQCQKINALFAAYGVQKGDRVIVQTEKCPMFVLIYLACLRAGIVFIPLNTAYTAQEVMYFVKNAEPKLFIGDPGSQAILEALDTLSKDIGVLTLKADGAGSFEERLSKTTASDEDIVVCQDDLAAILYTSGTTGHPKGAMVSNQNLTSNCIALSEAWQWREGDVLLHALPVFHIHGLFVALNCALFGCSTVLFHRNFNVHAIVDDLPNATVFMGVPTFYTRLLAHKDFVGGAANNIRLFTSGSAPLLTQTFEAFRERTGHEIVERYGMTETGIIASNPIDGARVPGSVGYPLEGVKARLGSGAEEQRGVLEVKGRNVFKGYWKKPRETAAEFTDDGYFITGDIAELNEDRISIVGRAKDLIISGGYNVYPKEVEAVIDAVEGVSEAAVIGVPHPDFGEAVVAVIVAQEGASTSSDTVKNAIAGQLAKFKQPKAIFCLASLPRNTMGKVQKNVLRDDFADLYAIKAP